MKTLKTYMNKTHVIFIHITPLKKKKKLKYVNTHNNIK